MTTPPPDETATAVDREAAWQSTSGDGLPALLKSAGGPFDVVQAYWPGNRMATQKTGVYVLRTRLDDNHPMSQRYRPMYLFRLKVVWPVKAATAELAEQEQRALDVAIGFLLQRIAARWATRRTAAGSCPSARRQGRRVRRSTSTTPSRRSRRTRNCAPPSCTTPTTTSSWG
jgi:hypothetical protein